MINLSHKIRNRIKLTLFIISILIPGGCKNDTSIVFHSPRNVSAFLWTPKDSLIWQLGQFDSIGSYATAIEIRHDNAYPYQNLGLELTLEKGDTIITRDTLNLNLTDANGNWAGIGWGSLYQSQHPYKTFHFPYNGHYTLIARPCMSDWKIKGIHSVGIQIRKNQ